MKNSRKRTYISPDTSFFKDHKALKKLKVNGLDDENRPLINIHEVKIILDATAVEKYLENKKSGNEVSIKTSVSNKKIDNVFSQRSNVMVKLEIPEDIKLDNTTLKDNFHFDNVSVKQEDHISVQDIVILNSDQINFEKLTELKEGDLQFQNENNSNDNYVALTTEVTKTEFKNEILDSSIWSEELTIGPEFKHEEIITQNNIITEPIKQENVAIEETPEPTIRRSSRKSKKICNDCDDCDYKVSKKPRTHTNVIKKHRPKLSDQNTNCSSKSKTPLKRKRRKINLISLQSDKDETQSYECDHCSYKTSRRSSMYLHLYNKHLLLFSKNLSCKYCEKKFKSEQQLKQHKYKCTSQFSFKCKFCLFTVTSKPKMKQHLLEMHEMEDKNIKDVVDEVCCDAITDVITALELEGHSERLVHLGEKYMRNNKYYRQIKNKFIKGWCIKCKSFERIDQHRNKRRCPDCNSERLFQCHECKMTSPYYQSIWRHLLSTDSSCNFSNDISFDRGEKPPRHSLKKVEATSEENSCERIHKCLICDYKGKTKLQLNKHMCDKHVVKSDISNNFFSDPDEKRSRNTQNNVVAVETTANEDNQQAQNCKVCDYKGTSELQLYKHMYNNHVVSSNIPCKNRSLMCSKCGKTYHFDDLRFKIHEDLCGWKSRFPCKFCFTTYMHSAHLRQHLFSAHADKFDENDTEDIVKEIKIFRCMLREYNVELAKTKYGDGTTEVEETMSDPSDYLEGIQSILRKVCCKCNTTVPQASRELCSVCCSILNFQCLRCDEHMEKYCDAWDHINKTCVNKIFTLEINESCKYPVRYTTKTVLYCDDCDFKSANKTILTRHIKKEHKIPVELMLYACFKCDRKYTSKVGLNSHLPKCVFATVYNCHICSYKARSSEHMTEHMIKWHSDLQQDDFDKSLSYVLDDIENNDESVVEFLGAPKPKGRRKFLENLESVRFHCPKCVVSFEKKARYIQNVKECHVCRSRLILECKKCEKVYARWDAMVGHFRKKFCSGIEPANSSTARTNQLDHLYAKAKIVNLEHSYASKYGAPETEYNGNH